MALKKCPECAKEVSSKAKICPHCGYKLKGKSGCLLMLGVGLGIIIFLAVLGSIVEPKRKEGQTVAGVIEPAQKQVSKASAEPKKPNTTHIQGETVSVGYTSYMIIKSWWSDKLSDNQFLDQKPNAKFLFVEVVVRNDDKKARTVPPFKLVDENEAEYDTSDKAWAVDGSLGIIENLNPNVSKQGFIVFDVPNNRSYNLKLSGGFWSTDNAFVTVAPK